MAPDFGTVEKWYWDLWGRRLMHVGYSTMVMEIMWCGINGFCTGVKLRLTGIDEWMVALG